jgi:prepilin-type N-terminal cleavage/methylation domain-containing protein
MKRRTALLSRRRPRGGCHGFTLLEILYAMTITTVGLLALNALFSTSIAFAKMSREDQICKQKAREALEDIYAARDDSALTFSQIQNVSAGGIFKSGMVPLYLPGSNGIVGTTSDTTTPDCIYIPGADGNLVINTPCVSVSDGTIVPLTNYQRQILIQPVLNSDGSTNPNIVEVTVTVQVTAIGAWQTRSYTVQGLVSCYR